MHAAAAGRTDPRSCLRSALSASIERRKTDHVCAEVRNRDVPRERWNPRAGHFEDMRPGERQDDPDFSRCRRRWTLWIA